MLVDPADQGSNWHLAAFYNAGGTWLSDGTYEGWRQLLVNREFYQRKGLYFFGSEQEFKAFHGKLTELTHLLWADNEIARHISVAQNNPHATKALIAQILGR